LAQPANIRRRERHDERQFRHDGTPIQSSP
jgi:hypothetical protein